MKIDKNYMNNIKYKNEKKRFTLYIDTFDVKFKFIVQNKKLSCFTTR